MDNRDFELPASWYDDDYYLDDPYYWDIQAPDCDYCGDRGPCKYCNPEEKEENEPIED